MTLDAFSDVMMIETIVRAITIVGAIVVISGVFAYCVYKWTK